MKKLTLLIVTLMLFALLSAGNAGMAEDCETLADLPINEYLPVDLLSEDFNPFYGIELPEGYNLYGVNLSKDQIKDEYVYALYFSTEADGDDVIKYMAALVGFDTPEGVQQMHDELFSENLQCFIPGEWTSSGLVANVNIEKTEEQKCEWVGCDYVEGYLVGLQKKVKGENYDNFITANNINTNAFANLTSYFDITGSENYNLYIRILHDNAEINLRYNLPDAKAIRSKLLEDADKNGWDYWKDESNGYEEVNWEYGGMRVIVKLDQADDGVIEVTENIEKMDMSFTNYVPESNFRNLKFNNNISRGRCDYHDDEAEIHIDIQKSEWKADYIDFNFNMDTGFGGGATYFPLENRYEVWSYSEDHNASYIYNSQTKEYSDIWVDDDSPIEEFMGKALGKEADESILYDPIEMFDQYINEKFAMTPDELFALDYE